MIFINPKTDYAFKKIFGSSESKDILISFLNALIYEGNSTIEDLEIINPNLPPKLEGLKDSYLDVKAKLKDGTLVIIEMQVLNVQSFGKRVLYNAAKTYAFQLEAAQGYRLLKPVIALTITDFEMFANSEEWISRFVFKEVNKNFTYPENDLDLVFVELPKFTKGEEELETLADKWIYFMKNARSLTSIPEAMDSIPEIQEAFNIANQSKLSREEVADLDRREQFIYDQQGAIMKATEEGREAGIEEGREEGKREQKLTIARQLLSRLDDETISQTTGLTLEDVRNLRSTQALPPNLG
ncbi:Rpn family recombination-promoting nuclease/putative transposase [Microcoleus sp. A2-C5]|uniref:Rpn family recombination-promoting nuclease/putative transposase n=1 Tax=Microcoleaceae TaxID=1892252 RepID=UPI00223749E8|nr:Rpn family recombination-promoting nuclease/putative transposase [Lyngbya sp. CCAP 1446/10]MCW6052065.1 Rpn family recombination-promoting nuclease/putative transposase [Lyngbya sp. CCAP 1446/10]